ncbi:hypothetical protein BpHYR1_010741 [Brachionus plicatilis]|uniref:Uncharacterized protein n=1 Tax=Brachionus plicatilis TaxID=10195 RepID=A0A3M7P2X0_BRAPC|nr:hypothetical protein BpHYR1_010741 [Brachionus plicatilis]
MVLKHLCEIRQVYKHSLSQYLRYLVKGIILSIKKLNDELSNNNKKINNFSITDKSNIFYY